MGAALPHGYVFGVCFALTALFCVMAINKALLACGTVFTLCGTVFILQSAGNIMSVCRLIAFTLFNTWCNRLVTLGYTAMSNAIIDVSDMLLDIGCTQEQILKLAAFFVMLLFAAVCVFSVIRRAKLVLLLCVYAAFVTVALYFVAIDKPIWLSLMLASVCAVVTLGLYDGVFCKKKSVTAVLGEISDSPTSRRELKHTLRANSSLGGYAGAFSALAALLVISLTAGISTPMKDIPKISHPAEKIQNYIISVFEGTDGPSNINADGSVRKGRETAAKKRTPSGSRVFAVHSDFDIPIYLRSWTGKDYYGDAWHTASDEIIEEYRDMFGTGFSHEFLTSELISAIDPTLFEAIGEASPKSLDFGFVSSYVHISKKSPSGSLVYMPSYTDQRARLMKYGTNAKLDFGGYQNYYDGIFVSSDYIFADEYTVLARLGLPPTEENVQNIARFVKHYANEYEMLRTMRTLLSEGASISQVRKAYTEMAADSELIATVSGEYIFPTGKDSLSYRYAFDMNGSERRHIDALTDNLSLYQGYVYDNYLTVHEYFSPFNSLVLQICQKNGIDMRRDAAAYDGRHRIVSAVIDYLSENMTYTLSPKEPSGLFNYPNGAAVFLFDTKEGYCSQYASAAIMLLRAAGIPARYAEGYIADKFDSSTAKNAPGKYVSQVNDSNAHAWVEVYYDYYGWVTYEATAPYTVTDTPPDTGVTTDTTASEDTTEPMPEASDTTAPKNTEGTTAPQDVTTSADTQKAPEEDTDTIGLKAVIIIVISSALLAVLAVVVISLKRRADREKDARKALIRRAKEGISDKEERTLAARTLGDTVMFLLSMKKLSPEKAETASAFAARVDAAFGESPQISFSKVMSAINAAEFGDDVTPEELTALAGSTEWLEAKIISEAGAIKRAIYKYFGVMS